MAKMIVVNTNEKFIETSDGELIAAYKKRAEALLKALGWEVVEFEDDPNQSGSWRWKSDARIEAQFGFETQATLERAYQEAAG